MSLLEYQYHTMPICSWKNAEIHMKINCFAENN